MVLFSKSTIRMVFFFKLWGQYFFKSTILTVLFLIVLLKKVPPWQYLKKKYHSNGTLKKKYYSNSTFERTIMMIIILKVPL